MSNFMLKYFKFLEEIEPSPKWVMLVFFLGGCAPLNRATKEQLSNKGQYPKGRSSGLSKTTDKPCVHDDKNFRCVKYVENYDGDTITFDIKGIHPLLGRRIGIRVSGVDTPEIKAKDSCEREKALLAKRVVASALSKAARIDLEDIDRGKYFRVIADVNFDGNPLNRYLLSLGLAHEYHGGKKTRVDWCKSTGR